MANTIDQAFIAQFGAEVKHAYQLDSKLLGVVRKREGVIGSTSRFQKLGAIAAYTKGRGADLTAQEPLHSFADAVLVDHYSSVLVDKLDLLKSNVDIKQEYVNTTAKAIAKAIDSTIITAITAGTNAATTNTGAMTVARLLEIKKMFDNAAVPQDGRTMLVSASSMEDLLGTTEVKSYDYNSVKALVQGEVDTFVGFKFVQVPDAYLTGTTDKVNIAFHRDAVGLAIGENIKPFMEWSPDKHGWWVGATASLGAVIVDPTGVVEFGVTI